MLTLLATLTVCLLSGTVGWGIASRIHTKKSMVIVWFVAGFAITYLALTWWKTVPPSFAQVSITSPKPAAEVDGFKLAVEGEVMPEWASVYVLVHPSKTGEWFVQDIPQFRRTEGPDKPTIWTTLVYLGKVNEGADEPYDIIALASSDHPWLDVLRDRLLQPNDTLKVIPLLNQSNNVTVKRSK